MCIVATAFSQEGASNKRKPEVQITKDSVEAGDDAAGGGADSSEELREADAATLKTRR